jgi:hypothetical protein
MGAKDAVADGPGRHQFPDRLLFKMRFAASRVCRMHDGFLLMSWDASYWTQTYALPLSRGALLPQTPAGGFTVEADMAKISGALTIRGYAVPGPTSGTYAFMRPTAQRNLFRIPIL